MTDNKNISGLINYNKEINYSIKEAIQEALVELMKNNDYNSITITALCKKAGVSRMAFYNNYKTLDNVIKSIVNNVNYEIVNAVGSPFRDEITEDWYLKLFYTVEDNKDFLKLMFNAEFKYRYLEMINELVLHNINNISLEEKNYRLLWAGGIVNRIIQWIDDELLESPEELASFCYSNFKKNNI